MTPSSSAAGFQQSITIFTTPFLSHTIKGAVKHARLAVLGPSIATVQSAQLDHMPALEVTHQPTAAIKISIIIVGASSGELPWP